MVRLAGGVLLLFLASPSSTSSPHPLPGGGEGFLRVWGNPFYWERYLFSLEYGFLSALLTLVLALPLAFLFRWRFPFREVFLALATLPFVLPTPVVALGFLALLGPRGALGVDLYGTLLLLLLAAVFYNLGLALRVLLPVALGLGGPLEAARVHGATPFRAFLRVGFPLLLPALGSAGSLFSSTPFPPSGCPFSSGGGTPPSRWRSTPSWPSAWPSPRPAASCSWSF